MISKAPFRCNARRWAAGLYFIAALALLNMPAYAARENQAASPVSYEKRELDARFFAEGVAAGDLDRDGHLDVVAGPFWFAGPSFKTRHEIYEPKPFDPLNYSDNFLAFTHDFDSDGWLDVMVFGFPGKDASWYRNPAESGSNWKRHIVHGEVGSESPDFRDIDGDGRPEIICISDGRFGYARADWDHPEQPWSFHPISEKGDRGRFTHGLGAADVDGDGKVDLLEQNGWRQQPAHDNGNSPWPWNPAPFAPNGGGAQMHAIDLSGDGLADVITAKNAHGYGLSWFEQRPDDNGKIEWREHVILPEAPATSFNQVQFSQLHAIEIGDMNGDGLQDIVTGKRWWAHGPTKDPEPNYPAVIYIFHQKRSADGSTTFDPLLVDSDSGVGTQIALADLNHDQRLDILTSNKKGTFVFLSTNAPQSAHAK